MLTRDSHNLQAALHSIIAETSARIAASKQPGAPSRPPDIWDASESINDLDAHLAMLEGPEYDRLMQVSLLCASLVFAGLVGWPC